MPLPAQSVPVINGVPVGAGQPIGITTLPSAGSLAGRRRTINGDMQIDQANVSAAVAVNAAGPIFSVDKWIGNGTPAAGIFNLQQRNSATVDAINFKNYLHVSVTTPDAAPAAASNYSLTTKVEFNLLEDLRVYIASGIGNPFIVGFWVRTSITGNFGGSIRNAGNNQNYPFLFNVPVANVFQFVGIPIPATAVGSFTTGLQITFDFGSGVNSLGPANAWAGGAGITGATGETSLMAAANTLDLTGVQLEPGNISTTYEQVPFALELMKCQREFYKTFLQGSVPAQNAGVNTGEIMFSALKAGATAGNFSEFSWPVIMRAAPAVTQFNPSAANASVRDETAAADCGASVNQNINERGIVLNVTGNAATAVGNILGVHLTADARL